MLISLSGNFKRSIHSNMKLKIFIQIKCFTFRHIDNLLMENAKELYTLFVDMGIMLADMPILLRSLPKKAMILLVLTREVLDTVKVVEEFMKTTEVYQMTNLASHICMIKQFSLNYLDFCLDNHLVGLFHLVWSQINQNIGMVHPQSYLSLDFLKKIKL